ncbi:MAG: orotidine-5'-phosphate decarboxylase [Candidatus Cloacimonetes bacterium]|nr:orotidine-5'-phosphate decarboxylase [Candidatus Cloacimonadota bacterium]
MSREQFIEELFKIGAVKFGTFTLKSGKVSPFYFDLRDMISYPELLDGIVELLVEKLQGIEFDVITGIPYTALPIASLVADRLQKPLIYMRKEEKAYGTGNNVIGKFTPGAVCIVIDDLITTGESKIETAERLEAEGVVVKDFVVVIDRSNDGSGILAKSGYILHSLIALDEILAILQKGKYIDNKMADQVKEFTQALAEESTQEVENLNPLTIKLKETMQRKQSNLILSLDVTSQSEFFRILDKTAAEIVMLKTHVDILDDYDEHFTGKLQEYARRYDFHIFEDRKFADIGNTVRMQYRKGIYRISEWSEFITVHLVAGAGILSGLFEGLTGRSSFLLARMSSKGNLINESYTRKVIEAGRKNPGVVSGFIGHGKDQEDIRRFKAKFPAGMLLLMPGVKLESGTDKLGQQYITIEDAIGGGADCIIVGRGIIQSENPGITAKIYRERAWKAYNQLNNRKAGK